VVHLHLRTIHHLATVGVEPAAFVVELVVVAAVAALTATEQKCLYCDDKA